MWMSLMSELLPPAQETILAVAGRNAGRYSRSGLAKLLTGSGSSRVASLTSDPDFGRLADRGRKAVTFEIDILVQQGFLKLDYNQHLIPGPKYPTP
jgi:hypothetical protein